MKKRLLTAPWRTWIGLALVGIFLAGCASSDKSVADRLMFWKDPGPKRLQPKRYDLGSASKTVPAPAAAVAETAEAAGESAAPIPDTGEVPEEDLTRAERREKERIDREAEAIREQHRIRSRLFGFF